VTSVSNHRQITVAVVVPRSVEAAATAVEVCRRLVHPVPGAPSEGVETAARG
jgi:hypothetical protein